MVVREVRHGSRWWVPSGGAGISGLQRSWPTRLQESLPRCLDLTSVPAANYINVDPQHQKRTGGTLLLDLTPDELLSTTRAVRKRLDFERPVEREVIEECIELAFQAPTGSNRQRWHFVVVTDQEQRLALADVWRRGVAAPNRPAPEEEMRRAYSNPASMNGVWEGLRYLSERLHEVPVLVVPCIMGRTDEATVREQAETWGSILPAVWSFMLAARSRGLGTVWTTPNLGYEREAAEILGIPFEEIMQAALIPVAYTIGTDFKPAPRASSDEAVHWDRW